MEIGIGNKQILRDCIIIIIVTIRQEDKILGNLVHEFVIVYIDGKSFFFGFSSEAGDDISESNIIYDLMLYKYACIYTYRNFKAWNRLINEQA